MKNMKLCFSLLFVMLTFGIIIHSTANAGVIQELEKFECTGVKDPIGSTGFTCCNGWPNATNPLAEATFACMAGGKLNPTCGPQMYLQNKIGCCKYVPDGLPNVKKICEKCKTPDCRLKT